MKSGGSTGNNGVYTGAGRAEAYRTRILKNYNSSLSHSKMIYERDPSPKLLENIRAWEKQVAEVESYRVVSVKLVEV
jgi:hypothetical protein